MGKMHYNQYQNSTEVLTLTLTLTHLRFDMVARTPIKLGGYQAGERLRDALARVMLRAVCPETQRDQKPSTEHTAVCPVCWLLAAELDPGVVRRAYSLAPPFPLRDALDSGEPFSFTLTLFGQGFQYLPYFVLAVPEMGRIGVGPGRGRFDLQSIWSINPLQSQVEAVLSPGEQVVRVPQEVLDWRVIQDASGSYVALLDSDNVLRLEFLTPTRLIESQGLVKAPDFSVFFRRLLERIDQLSRQHAYQETRPREDVERLYSLADRVRLVAANVDWVELWGPSGRTGRKTPMGGFVGTADYWAKDWRPLMPWLLLGQGVQAGKLAAKGNGLFQVILPGVPRYWEQVFSHPAGSSPAVSA